MPDMEKVVSGLKELSGFLFKEYGKAQAEEASLYYDRFLTVDNAIALLKKQEPMEPITDKWRNYACPVCGNRLRGGKFCMNCGQAVKQNEDD